MDEGWTYEGKGANGRYRQIDFFGMPSTWGRSCDVLYHVDATPSDHRPLLATLGPPLRLRAVRR
eukprot:2079259-Lingulodinium_polyedra.AAC.1